MASPLHVFRKYQYLFLVAFGIMLMFAFVIAPPLDDYLRSRAGVGGGGGDAAVVWAYGAVSEAELTNLRSRHVLTMRFLRSLVSRVEVEEAVSVKRGEETVTLIKGRSYPVVNEGFGESGERTFQIVVEGQLVDVPQTAARLVTSRVPMIAGATDEQQLFRKMLLEKKAEELGVVITDEAILEYFDNLSDTTAARRPNYNALLAEATNGRLNEAALMAQMRMELMTQRVQMMAQSGLYSAPPESLFEYYDRLNRRITAELLPVNVASLTGEVPDPSEAEITALYDAGKNRFPFPSLPDPGFKQRRKIAFGYFQGVLEDFIQREIAVIDPTITEEDIVTYYEQNKETEFKIPELPPAEDEPVKEPEGEGDVTGSEPMEDASATGGATEATQGGDAAAGSTPPPAGQDPPPPQQDPTQQAPPPTDPGQPESKPEAPRKKSRRRRSPPKKQRNPRRPPLPNRTGPTVRATRAGQVARTTRRMPRPPMRREWCL